MSVCSTGCGSVESFEPFLCSTSVVGELHELCLAAQWAADVRVRKVDGSICLVHSVVLGISNVHTGEERFYPFSCGAVDRKLRCVTCIVLYSWSR